MGERVAREALGKGVAHATELASVGLVSQVGLLVAPQLGGQGVGPAAPLAAERALACVQALVGMQRVGVPQRLAADGAQVGLARVGDEMSPQLWQLGEGVAAEAALVGLLARVQAEVLAQVALLSEVLAAVGTGVRSLPRVQAHVVAQGARVGQVTSTYGTLASLGTSWASPGSQVDLPVNAEGGPACKGLATLLAGEGALAGVQDLVLLQVSLGAVRLVALGALERPHALVGQHVGLEALL